MSRWRRRRASPCCCAAAAPRSRATSLVAQALVNLVDNATEYPAGRQGDYLGGADAGGRGVGGGRHGSRHTIRRPLAGGGALVRLEASRNSPEPVWACRWWRRWRITTAPSWCWRTTLPASSQSDLPQGEQGGADQSCHDRHKECGRIVSRAKLASCPIYAIRPCRSMPRRAARTLEDLAGQGFALPDAALRALLEGASATAPIWRGWRCATGDRQWSACCRGRGAAG